MKFVFVLFLFRSGSRSSFFAVRQTCSNAAATTPSNRQSAFIYGTLFVCGISIMSSPYKTYGNLVDEMIPCLCTLEQTASNQPVDCMSPKCVPKCVTRHDILTSTTQCCAFSDTLFSSNPWCFGYILALPWLLRECYYFF